MSAEDYEILIFGDKTHPEVMGVRSYAKNPENVHVVLNLEEAKALNLTNTKIATVAQTTKKKEMYLEIVNYLTLINKEVRIFNTICDATFENQDAARKLSKEVDVMVIIGGKSSSNTKQLQTIALENCKDAYLIENKNDLQDSWFKDKKLCGITAGASTPDWIIKEIVEQIKSV
ncbi:MAG: 4-hydroxy-3-methylbut-2-enyl diphosphate reductase [Arcobacter lacus]|nr:MAG: 4-hydroxy-3-methylbut-2-enyl diphosphate reductase [Arcobacter lacus]